MVQSDTLTSLEEPKLAGKGESVRFQFYHYYTGPRPTLASGSMSWTPPVDLYETAEELVLEVDLAGIEPDNVQIQVSEKLVSLQGTREETQETAIRCYEIMEIERGTFERAVELPGPVDTDSARATYHDGVLVLRMRKISGK